MQNYVYIRISSLLFQVIEQNFKHFFMIKGLVKSHNVVLAIPLAFLFYLPQFPHFSYIICYLSLSLS